MGLQFIAPVMDSDDDACIDFGAIRRSKMALVKVAPDSPKLDASQSNEHVNNDSDMEVVNNSNTDIIKLDKESNPTSHKRLSLETVTVPLEPMCPRVGNPSRQGRDLLMSIIEKYEAISSGVLPVISTSDDDSSLESKKKKRYHNDSSDLESDFIDDTGIEEMFQSRLEERLVKRKVSGFFVNTATDASIVKSKSMKSMKKKHCIDKSRSKDQVENPLSQKSSSQSSSRTFEKVKLKKKKHKSIASANKPSRGSENDTNRQKLSIVAPITNDDKLPRHISTDRPVIEMIDLCGDSSDQMINISHSTNNDNNRRVANYADDFDSAIAALRGVTENFLKSSSVNIQRFPIRFAEPLLRVGLAVRSLLCGDPVSAKTSWLSDDIMATICSALPPVQDTDAATTESMFSLSVIRNRIMKSLKEYDKKMSTSKISECRNCLSVAVTEALQTQIPKFESRNLEWQELQNNKVKNISVVENLDSAAEIVPSIKPKASKPPFPDFSWTSECDDSFINLCDALINNFVVLDGRRRPAANPDDEKPSDFIMSVPDENWNEIIALWPSSWITKKLLISRFQKLSKTPSKVNAISKLGSKKKVAKKLEQKISPNPVTKDVLLAPKPMESSPIKSDIIANISSNESTIKKKKKFVSGNMVHQVVDNKKELKSKFPNLYRKPMSISTVAVVVGTDGFPKKGVVFDSPQIQ